MRNIAKLGCAAAIAALTSAPTLHATVIEEDLASAPNGGLNGWNPAFSNCGGCGRSNDEGGKLVIATLGNNTSVSYSQPNAAPHTGAQWMNAEMNVRISASDEPAANEAGLGSGTLVGNDTFQYVMGLTATDAGSGNVNITLRVLNTSGPPPIAQLGSHTFVSSATAINRYNAEVEGANLALYVNGGSSVFTVPIASLNSGPGPFLQFGDLRSGPDSTSDIFNVRYSTGEVLVPEPGVAVLMLLGVAGLHIARRTRRAA